MIDCDLLSLTAVYIEKKSGLCLPTIRDIQDRDKSYTEGVNGGVMKPSRGLLSGIPSKQPENTE